MSERAPASNPRVDPPEYGGVAETIEALVEGDLVIVDEGRSTWTVTDVHDQDFGPDDERTEKRVVRIVTSDRVAGLVLECYPERDEVEFHQIDPEPEPFVEDPRPVSTLKVVDAELDWAVIKTTGTETYHRPDGLAAFHGEAQPACHDTSDGEAAEYRLVRFHQVYPAKDPCKRCFRHQRPVDLGPLRCPECERQIAEGVLRGPHVEAVGSVGIDCPFENCSFSGALDLA